MALRRVGWAALFGGLGVVAAAGQELQEALQPLLDEVSKRFGCSMTASVKLSSLRRPVTVVSGPQGRSGPGLYAWGSVTKMWTGAAVMRLAERGVVNLDASAAQYIDPILAEMANQDPLLGFASMEDLFGEEAANVTVRHLAAMQSGIPDFDTAKPFPLPVDPFRRTIYAHPTEDFPPPKLLSLEWVKKGKLDFVPGSKTEYSSTNFVLLGLLLAHGNGRKEWDKLDQGGFIPFRVRWHLGRDFTWATRNSPAELGVVRGVDRTHYNGEVPELSGGIDVSERHGVFAGWTASDFVGTSSDVAELGHALYGKEAAIVSKEYVDQMIPTGPFYGFATFNLTRMTEERDGKFFPAYGHLGATYGYDSLFVYQPDLDMSIAVASSIETDRQSQPAEAFCLLASRARSWVLKERARVCTFEKVGYYGVKCTCKPVEGQTAAPADLAV